jgi:site-specific DNA recombinase
VTRMGTAVIYARFSCSKQREASIDDQLRVCSEWCARNNYDVLTTYCDHAVSGRTDDRPAFQEMVANAGESDAVVVYMMDRFSRDPYDAPVYKRHFRERGVRIISAMENVPDTPEGMLLDKLLEGMAAMESAKNSVRTRRGMEGNALKCLYNGDRVYGYTVDPTTKRYAINEIQAAYVREAFARRLSGEPCNAIARDFAARGVTTYRGNPCSAQMVSSMIRNERYAGVYIWGNVRVEGSMPTIVDRQTWEAAQTAPRKKRRRSEEWRDYRLSGRSKCRCGSNLVGVSGHGSTGARYDYYRCGRRCGVPNVRADVLEAAVVYAVREVLGNRAEALRIAHTVEKYVDGTEGQAKRKAAADAKKTATATLKNLMDAVKRGLTHPSMQSEIDAATVALERAERELLLLDSVPRFDAEDFADFLQFGATLDDDAVLSAFVGEVVLFDGYAAVTFNYDDSEGNPAYCEVEFEENADGSPYACVCERTAMLVVPL